jgi:methyl-accepting chemotaxis protein
VVGKSVFSYYFIVHICKNLVIWKLLFDKSGDFMKIGFKLSMIMIILSLLSSIAIGVPLMIRSYKSINDLSYEYADILSKEMAAETEKYLDAYWNIVETSSQIMEDYHLLDLNYHREYVSSKLQLLVEKNPKVIGAWVIMEPNAIGGPDRRYIGQPDTDQTGRFVPYWYRDGNDVKLDDYTGQIEEATEDYYTQPRDKNTTVVINPYLYEIEGEQQLQASVAAPVHSLAGRFIGVIGIDINVEEVQKISQTYHPFGDGHAFVVGNNGVIVAHHDESLLGQKITDAEDALLGKNRDRVLETITKGGTLTYQIFDKTHGEELIVFFSPIAVGDTPWSFVIEVPRNSVLRPLIQMVNITLIMSGVIIVLVFIASVFLARSISKPIVRVAVTLKDIAEGEGDLTRSIKVSSQDEIGDLAHYFNLTLDKIKRLVISIKKSSGVLSGIGNDLAGNMSETAAAVNEITANIQSIKGRIVNQSASVSETNSIMENVVVNIKKLNGHIEEQSENVSRASSAIEEMVANTRSVTETLIKNEANVKTLMESSEAGRSGLQHVVTDIQEISKESEGLLEINSVMENIASQTNLLSMNAAIEAAHAGESGKGFAVVAAEIRKLAESSTAQSKTISEVLKKIKSSIDKITISADNVLDKFKDIDTSVRVVAQQQDNIRNAMEEQGVGSKQILEGVGHLNEITRDVKKSSNEMEEGSQEVIRESQNLDKVTQEIRVGMNEMAEGAEHINKAVNHVNDISGKNREGIEGLIVEVSRFKVE